MPIANTAYARYYEKNREALTEKMRSRYDADKKRAYYEEHKEEMKKRMADRYKKNKEERNLSTLRQMLSRTPPDSVKEVIDDLIKTERYKTINKQMLNFLERQIPTPQTASA